MTITDHDTQQHQTQRQLDRTHDHRQDHDQEVTTMTMTQMNEAQMQEAQMHETPEFSLTALLDTAAAQGATGQDASSGFEAPCQQEDPELWFAEAPDDVEFAKALCRMCPVQEQCFAGALERREPWGVWGGQLFLAGRVVAAKRPRGRPRKDAAAVAASTVAQAAADAAKALATRAS